MSVVLERRVHRMDDDHRPGKPLNVQIARLVPPTAAVPPSTPAASDQPQEITTMPRGQYDRSKSKPRKATTGKASGPPAPGAAEHAIEKVARKKRKAASAGKPTRRARQERPTSGARFAVWSDGSVSIDAPECKGKLDGADVDLLYTYVKRLRGE